jgi:hypothetical protein
MVDLFCYVVKCALRPPPIRMSRFEVLFWLSRVQSCADSEESAYRWSICASGFRRRVMNKRKLFSVP